MPVPLPMPVPPLLSVQAPDTHLARVTAYYVMRLQGLSLGSEYHSHQKADGLLCDFLWEAGLGEVADAYRSAKSQIGFSY